MVQPVHSDGNRRAAQRVLAVDQRELELLRALARELRHVRARTTQLRKATQQTNHHTTRTTVHPSLRITRRHVYPYVLLLRLTPTYQLRGGR